MKMKNNVMTAIAIAVLMIALVSATFAYFTAQAGGTTSRNVSVTSNTTDNLAFQISNDISFTVTQADFYENAGNRDGYATATAILTPNNNTGAATDHYYLYLVLESNPTVYSEANTNELPELMLQLFDSSNQLVTLANLGSQETVGGVTGYDITGLEGKVALLSNQTISASNNTATTQTWKVVITLINHNFNQNDNTGKTIEGRLEIRKDALPDYVYWNNLFDGAHYDSSHKPTTTYTSLEDLESANVSSELHNFTLAPIYIKTEMVSGSVVGHQSCITYNDIEFCIGPNYWVETGNGDQNHISYENGEATMEKLKADLEATYGITFYDSYELAQAANSTNFCGYRDTGAECSFDVYDVVIVNSDFSYVEYGTQADYCAINSLEEGYCYYFD